MIRTIGVAAILATAAIASPSAAESWAAFSRSDATVYLVDVDALTPVAPGAATAPANTYTASGCCGVPTNPRQRSRMSSVR